MEKTFATSKSNRLSSAKEIADFVNEELVSASPHYGDIIRGITHEIDRWAKNGVMPKELTALTSENWTTGSKQWDALLEGVVLYYYHKFGWPNIPQWCYRTNLDSNWFVRSYLISDEDTYTQYLFETPGDILNKGLIFSRHEMQKI